MFRRTKSDKAKLIAISTTTLFIVIGLARLLEDGFIKQTISLAAIAFFIYSIAFRVDPYNDNEDKSKNL